MKKNGMGEACDMYGV